MNREPMLDALPGALRREFPRFTLEAKAVDPHRNHVAREHHFGTDVYMTRKGAVRAGRGERGIIPGSTGARSFIVHGRGEHQSFETCSHRAGRLMSRTEASKRFSLADHRRATADVECRRDAGVLDETPGAYKPIDRVMDAQRGLVDVVEVLRRVVCVKG